MNRPTDAPKRSRRTARRAAAATLAAGLLLAACGDDDNGVAMTGTAPPAATGETVEVTLADYKFEGIPDSVPAGTTFTVVNESKIELHEFVAFRLEDDDDRTAAQIAKLPPEELGELFSGEPATVLLAAPGGEQIAAVGDGTLEEPGRYVIFCAIPTGADPQEYLDAASEATDGPPQVAGGAPHFVNGMYGEVTVES